MYTSLLLQVAYAATILVSAEAFVHVPSTLTRGCPASRRSFSTTRRSTPMVAQVEEGMHGTRSRFLPIIQVEDNEIMPRIVQIAGALPDLTVEDLNAVSSSPAAEMGNWQYDFSDPEGPQMGTVALPGTSVTLQLSDPVAIVSPNDKLNVSLPNDEIAECLVVIDRGVLEFEVGKFFLWDTPNGLQIRFFESQQRVIEGFVPLGKVILVYIPFLPSMTKKSTGFQEEDELF
ncbi:unnamed protein product [Choristocarpus tenellus]